MPPKSANIYLRIEPEVKEQADADLRGIHKYIALELKSPENATGQLDRLEESIL